MTNENIIQVHLEELDVTRVITWVQPLLLIRHLTLQQTIDISQELIRMVKKTHKWTDYDSQFRAIFQNRRSPRFEQAFEKVTQLQPSSFRQYLRGFNAASRFLAGQLTPQHKWKDVTTQDIVWYFRSKTAKGIASQSLESYKTALAFFLTNLQCWDLHRLASVTKTSKILFGKPQRKKEPLTGTMIYNLWVITDWTNRRQHRDFALVFFSWLAYLRNDEARFLTWKDVRMERYTKQGTARQAILICLAQDKTHLPAKAQVIAIFEHKGHPIDPFYTWLQYKQRFAQQSAYVFPNFKDPHKPLEYATCNKIFQRAVKAFGADPMLYGTHSARIGGVTEALKAMLPPEAIGKHGRWATAQWYSYYYDPRFCQNQVTTALVQSLHA
jgi:integrase